MSKWGIEEEDTIKAIEEIGFHGTILNIAAGDGRFNNKLLEKTNKVVAIDNNKEDLEVLISNCPSNLKSKLSTNIVDMTKQLPYGSQQFDGIFCTGTLHLFKDNIIINILNEMKRVLKKRGKILLDFATDITRYDSNKNKVLIDGEGSYTAIESIKIFKENLKEFNINIEISTFKEEDLDDTTGYKYIEGKFLIISGTKK